MPRPALRFDLDPILLNFPLISAVLLGKKRDEVEISKNPVARNSQRSQNPVTDTTNQNPRSE